MHCTLIRRLRETMQQTKSDIWSKHAALNNRTRKCYRLWVTHSINRKLQTTNKRSYCSLIIPSLITHYGRPKHRALRALSSQHDYLYSGLKILRTCRYKATSKPAFNTTTNNAKRNTVLLVSFNWTWTYTKYEKSRLQELRNWTIQSLNITFLCIP